MNFAIINVSQHTLNLSFLSRAVQKAVCTYNFQPEVRHIFVYIGHNCQIIEIPQKDIDKCEKLVFLIS